ncbi:MAG: hypothetical protein ACYDEQ_13700, partial [Desulfocucumaceae bacterium]
RIVKAYAEERYKGNLMDLFISPEKRLKGSKLPTADKPRFFLSMAKSNELYRQKLVSEVARNNPAVLDNGKLDGFLDFFVAGKCRRIDCETCGYCRGIAEKALYLPEDYRLKAISVYKKVLAEIIGPEKFRP